MKLRTLGLIAGAVIVAVIVFGNASDPAPVQLKPPPSEQEQRARVVEDAKRLAIIAGAVQLKKAMHDPASFELVQALQMDDGSGCYTYRATNGFGAVRTAYAVMNSESIITSQDDRFHARWKRYCQGKRGVQIK